MKNANQPCYCGSGKKTKKCHPNERKPRNITITYDFGEPKTVNNFEFNPLTGEVKFHKDEDNIDVKSVNLEVSYERPRKRKVLNQIPLTPPKYTLNPNIALNKFDLLLAIDTNTEVINQNKLSVTCLVKGFVKIDKFVEKAVLSLEVYDSINAVARWNVEEKEENIGWTDFIIATMKNPFYKENMKVGIITDSDFGNIEDFNKRNLPIYDDFYLPLNMEIIHATRDGGDEYFANKLIRLADKEAKKWINEAKQLLDLGTIDAYLNSQPIENKPYTHWKHLA